MAEVFFFMAGLAAIIMVYGFIIMIGYDFYISRRKKDNGRSI